MAYRVLRVPSVGKVVDGMSRVERERYDAAVAALRGEGCKAGGKRLLATNGEDYAMCQRDLYGDWRMTTVIRSDGSIVIVSVARHSPRENPNAMLAEVFPGLSSTGRRRSNQPSCCEDPALPPRSDEVDAVLDQIFGLGEYDVGILMSADTDLKPALEFVSGLPGSATAM